MLLTNVKFVLLRFEHVSRISNYFVIKILKTVSRDYKNPVARFKRGPNLKCCPKSGVLGFVGQIDSTRQSYHLCSLFPVLKQNPTQTSFWAQTQPALPDLLILSPYYIYTPKTLGSKLLNLSALVSFKLATYPETNTAAQLS